MPTAAIKVSDDGNTYVTQLGVGGMFPGLLGYFLRWKGPSGFGGSSTSDQVVAHWDGVGKTAIVTGAATGLGFDTARALASKGCEVIVTARNQAKAEATVEKLKTLVPDAKLVPMALDLSDQSSIKEFVKSFVGLKKPLNILMNNAGVMAIPKFTPTKDGYESQLGVNHFGHYTLTNLLLPTMIQTAKSSGVEGRIVNTSSVMHQQPYKEGIRLEGYNDPKTYDAWAAYGQSKLANVLFTRELALRLANAGAPVATYSLHPGGIHTDLQRDVPYVMQFIIMGLGRPFMKSVKQGSATQVLAATAPSGWAPSGEYLADCNVCVSSARAHDAQLGRGLWELSERVTGVKGAV